MEGIGISEEKHDETNVQPKLTSLIVSFGSTGNIANLLEFESALLENFVPQWGVMRYLVETKDSTETLDETVNMLVVCFRILGANKHRMEAFDTAAKQLIIKCKMHRRLTIGQVVDYLQKIGELRKQLETSGFV